MLFERNLRERAECPGSRIFASTNLTSVKSAEGDLVAAMPVPTLCHSGLSLLRQVEPVIVLEELGSSLFDTALQMVVLDRSANATDSDPHTSESHSQQIAMTNFYMVYNLIIRFIPIVPALLLARLGDRGWRRTPIIVPLVGYLVPRLALLLVVIFKLPIKVMYGAAVLFGLTGGYSAYWPGVMTLASLGSTAADRSKVKTQKYNDINLK